MAPNKTSRVSFLFQPDTAKVMARGLCNLVNVDGGATNEQLRILSILFVHLFGLKATTLDFRNTLEASELAAVMTEAAERRRFMQLATILELCRHPKSDNQLRKLEDYGDALHISGDELNAAKELCRKSAKEAAADYVRTYQIYFPDLSESHHTTVAQDGELHYDNYFFEKLESFHAMPQGSLGKCFAEFYARSGLTIPTRQTVNPGYYVWHDMGHVITGYEATSIGEVCLGAFKLALHDSDANWMASLTNFMIHEAGLLKVDNYVQYVANDESGDPYGADHTKGVMEDPGAPDFLAEALQRGSTCTGDFTSLDHLAIADMPLIEIRRQYNVVPLKQSMFDDAHLWPN
jgi:hypothetical protein